MPVAKPARQTYEWLVPRGILKRNWMRKHLNVLPSVVVVFADIDWTDSVPARCFSSCGHPTSPRRQKSLWSGKRWDLFNVGDAGLDPGRAW